MWYDRTGILIGKGNIEKLSKSHIAVFGVGGVGSYVVEALVRAGIGEITIIDADNVVCILSGFNPSDVQQIVSQNLLMSSKMELCKSTLKFDQNSQNYTQSFYELLHATGVEVLEEIKRYYDIDIGYRDTILSYLSNDNQEIINPQTINDILSPITRRIGQARMKLFNDFGVAMELNQQVNGIPVRVYVTNPNQRQNVYRRLDQFMQSAFDSRMPKLVRECMENATFHDERNPLDYYWAIHRNKKSINHEFYSAATGGYGMFTSWHLAATSLDTVAHEFGHSFDTKINQTLFGKNGYFSMEPNSIWQQAKKLDGNAVSSYGENTFSEDFAESTSKFVTNREEFYKKHPNRARVLEQLLRDYAEATLNLRNVTTIQQLVPIMLNNGINQSFIDTAIRKGFSFEQIKEAFIQEVAYANKMSDMLNIRKSSSERIELDFYSNKIDSGDLLRRSNSSAGETTRLTQNHTIKKEDSPFFGNSEITESPIPRENVKNRMSNWFNNKFFGQAATNINPIVNQINQTIASGYIAQITIRNAADLSVADLRQISDLSRVNIHVSGIFSDLNGNVKAKYNNPRYIARHTYTGTELIAINAKLDELQSRIDMSLPITQRARQIYELIASEYSYLKPANGTRDRFNEAEYLVSQSLRGVTSSNIIGRQGLICAGYASVFKELCTRCGITADYIRGDVVVDRLTNRTGKHAWNVFIDENGNAIPVDACWRSSGGRDYFGRSNMFAEGRYADPDEAYMDVEAAKAIYLGIVHDTGVFQYSSLTPDTMRKAANLISYGFDFSKLIDETYYKKTYAQTKVMGRVVLDSKRLLDGSCMVGVCNQEMMAEYGVGSKDFEGIVNQLRNVEGVSVAIFMYEVKKDEFKVSLRSDGTIDVSVIATHFAGGGHKRAAGFTLNGTSDEVTKCLLAEIEKQRK